MIVGQRPAEEDHVINSIKARKINAGTPTVRPPPTPPPRLTSRTSFSSSTLSSHSIPYLHCMPCPSTSLRLFNPRMLASVFPPPPSVARFPQSPPPSPRLLSPPFPSPPYFEVQTDVAELAAGLVVLLDVTTTRAAIPSPLPSPLPSPPLPSPPYLEVQTDVAELAAGIVVLLDVTTTRAAIPSPLPSPPLPSLPLLPTLRCRLMWLSSLQAL